MVLKRIRGIASFQRYFAWFFAGLFGLALPTAAATSYLLRQEDSSSGAYAIGGIVAAVWVGVIYSLAPMPPQLPRPGLAILAVLTTTAAWAIWFIVAANFRTDGQYGLPVAILALLLAAGLWAWWWARVKQPLPS